MKSTDLLHAYTFAANPRKPAQNLAFAREASRKFGLEALPENLEDSATAEALQAICDLDLTDLQAIVPPRGFGRD